MTHEESKIQQDCVKWFRYQYPNFVLFAIPNGGRRSKTEAGIMKGEGVLSGVADLFLMKPNTFMNGLFIEIKTAKGVQSDSQKAFCTNALVFGFDYSICRSVDEFIEVVTKYLNK